MNEKMEEKPNLLYFELEHLSFSCPPTSTSLGIMSSDKIFNTNDPQFSGLSTQIGTITIGSPGSQGFWTETDYTTGFLGLQTTYLGVFFAFIIS